ncbi:MAG: hypothetical protein GY938_11285 [Ketobacter sp.]|nr:hypothetical protein [Ketobacter sp.]
METSQYYEIHCVCPGGVSDNAFLFQDWNGVEFIISGLDLFVTPTVCAWLVEQGLAQEKRRWCVVEDDQYREICKLAPPEEICEIRVASTLYDAGLYFQNGVLIAEQSVNEELKKRSNTFNSKLTIPLSYKYQSTLNPLAAEYQGKLGTWGETPLHWQAAKLDPVVVGVNVDSQDDFGFTPLHDAICAGNLQAIESLLNAGSNLALETKHGFNAIDFTLLFDQVDVLELFHHRGLVEFDNRIIKKIFDYKSLQCLHCALQTNIDVNYRETDADSTYLMSAISWRNLDVILALLKLGADPNAVRTGLHQTTVLGKALESWDPEVVDAVLNHGANPNASILQRAFEPPLVRSLMTDCSEQIVRALLRHGASTSLQYRNGTIMDRVRKIANSPISDIQRTKCHIVLQHEEAS